MNQEQQQQMQQLAADYQPLYLNAKHWYYNDFRGESKEETIGRNINGWYLFESRSYGQYHFRAQNDLEDHVVSRFSNAIMLIFDILNYGIVKASTLREIKG